MEIKVDGEPVEVGEEASLAEVLRRLGEPVGHVLVEVNKHYVRPSEYDVFKLKAGDRVEIIFPAVGG